MLRLRSQLPGQPTKPALARSVPELLRWALPLLLQALALWVLLGLLSLWVLHSVLGTQSEPDSGPSGNTTAPMNAPSAAPGHSAKPARTSLLELDGHPIAPR